MKKVILLVAMSLMLLVGCDKKQPEVVLNDSDLQVVQVDVAADVTETQSLSSDSTELCVDLTQTVVD